MSVFRLFHWCKCCNPCLQFFVVFFSFCFCKRDMYRDKPLQDLTSPPLRISYILSFASSNGTVLEYHFASLMSICKRLHTHKPEKSFKDSSFHELQLKYFLQKWTWKVISWKVRHKPGYHNQCLPLRAAYTVFSHINSIAFLQHKVQFIHWFVD